jgi:hypothetical protein
MYDLRHTIPEYLSLKLHHLSLKLPSSNLPTAHNARKERNPTSVSTVAQPHQPVRILSARGSICKQLGRETCRRQQQRSVERWGAGANEQVNSYKGFFGYFFDHKKVTVGNAYPYC